jgi:predicted RNase H-like HicB family nuclease
MRNIEQKFMAKVSLKHLVWKEGKHYVAQCLNVDVSSFGESREEALKNLDEALDLYFENQPNASISKISGPELVSSVKSYA